MRKFLLTCFSALILMASSCDKTADDLLNPEQKDGYRLYTIRKGTQSSGTLTSAVNTTELKFKVIFDSTAIYTCVTPENQKDINKLYGFSDCGKEHHSESARFGWRWSDNALRLFAYCYKNSVMSFKEIGTVTIGAENSCSIRIDGGNYVFNLNGTEVTMERGCTDTTGSRFKLFPFFGGSENAPHDILIKIKEEK